MTWQTKKLGDLAMIVDGTHQTPKYISEGIPFYSVENVTANNFSETKFVSDKVYMQESKDRKIRKNDILMTRIGDIGTAKLIDWDVKASFYVSLALIRCDYKQIAPRYLVQVINSSIFKKELLKKSLLVAFPNKINLGDINKCTLRLPKLAEQERIVGVLGVWDEYLEKLERKIVLKEESKHSLIKKIFQNKDIGWSRDRLSSVADFINGYIFKSADYDKDGIFKVITIANVQSGKMTIGDGTNFIKHIPGDIQSDQILKIGDILISMTGNVGRVCLVDNENCLLNQRVGKILPKKIDRYFLYHQINNSKFISEMFRKSQGGAQDNLSVGAIMDHQIFIPKKTEQERIASILNDCDREIELLKSKKSQIEQQKKFLLKKLVSGELRTPEDILEKGVSR